MARIIPVTLLCAAAALPFEVQGAPPPPDALAPIIIPEGSLTQTDFAQQLDKACGAVAKPSIVAVDAPLAPSDLASAQQTSVDRALGSMRHACEAVLGEPGEHAFTDNDLATLTVFRGAPAELAARLEAFARSAAAVPAGSSLPPLTFEGLAENVVSGLASFVYDRARAEAILYLREQLTHELCQPEYRLFLPSTCTALTTADLGLSLQSMGSFFATAARKDVKQFPDTALAYGFYTLRDKDSDPAKEAQREIARNLLLGGRIGLTYYRAVAAGRHPLDVVRSLHLITSVDGATPGIYAGLVLTSQLLDAITQQNGWNTLNANSPTAEIRCYVAGIILALRDLPSTEPHLLDVSTPAAATRVRDRASTIRRLILDAAVLAKQIDDRAKLTAGPAPGAGSMGGLPVVGGGIAAAAGPSYAALTTRIVHVALRDGLALAAAFGHASAMDAQALTAFQTVAAVGEQVVATVETSGGDPSAIVLAALELVDQLGQQFAVLGDGFHLKIPGPVREAIPFVAQLAQAKTADEAREVIAAAAVPVSTYQIKYKRPVVALGGIVGVDVGQERVDLHNAVSSGVAGAFAPVGFTASQPFAGNRWYVAGMVSVLNVGALVSARFHQDTTTSGGETQTLSSDSKVDWANILTPGAFVTLGAARSPFTFGAGVQIVPHRTIETSTGTTTSTSSRAAVQSLVSLGVDVPLFVF